MEDTQLARCSTQLFVYRSQLILKFRISDLRILKKSQMFIGAVS